jgi:phosphoribosylanthranilate isomerase
MPLKTVVKVGNISNLSDARYCSGMGVDMLGYAVLQERDAFISAKRYQEIRGWIAGPLTVAELYGLKDVSHLSGIMEAYQPDYLEVDFPLLSRLEPTQSIPLIVNIEHAEDLQNIHPWKERILYIQVKESQQEIIDEAAHHYKVLLLLQSHLNVQSWVDHSSIHGIALIGSPEIRPGFKDYGDLAEVLEQLEID